MGSIQQKLNYILETKKQMRLYLQNDLKQPIDSSTPFREYAKVIDNIPKDELGELNIATASLFQNQTMTDTNLKMLPYLKNVNSCAYMFEGATGFTTIDVFDTSGSTSFANCFRNSSIERYPMLNTAAATTHEKMFQGCTNLKGSVQLDLSSSKYLSYLFDGCVNLEEIIGFNPSSAVSSMSNCFPTSSSIGGCKLAKLKFADNITFKGQNFSIQGCSFTRDSLVELFNSLPDISAYTARGITVKLNPGTSELTTEDIAIATAKNWTVIK